MASSSYIMSLIALLGLCFAVSCASPITWNTVVNLTAQNPVTEYTGRMFSVGSINSLEDDTEDIVFFTAPVPRVCWNQGDRSFQCTDLAATDLYHPLSTRLADMDEDGFLDIVQATKICWGDGTSNSFSECMDFPQLVHINIPHPLFYSTEGDFNNDGHKDILVYFQQSFPTVERQYAVFLSSSSPRTWLANDYIVPANLTGAATALNSADLNGDGNLDVVIGRYNEAPTVCLGDGTGNHFTCEALPEMHLSSDYTFNIEIEDVGNDGSLDILRVNLLQ